MYKRSQRTTDMGQHERWTREGDGHFSIEVTLCTSSSKLDGYERGDILFSARQTGGNAEDLETFAAAIQEAAEVAREWAEAARGFKAA